MIKLALLAFAISGCITIKVEPAKCPDPVQPAPIMRFGGESTCCMPTLPSDQNQIFLAPNPDGGTITLHSSP